MTVELKDITLDHPDVFCALTQFQHAGNVPQEKLFTALKDNNIPEDVWPKPPSTHVCLGRALKEAAGRRDRVEPIDDGWVLTVTHTDKLDLENPDNTGRDAHEVCVTAKVIKAGEAIVLRITPEDSPHAGLIRHEYDFQQGQFKAAEDLSRWLSQVIIPWVGGVAAKARGGAYYVTKGPGLDRMKQVKAALDSVSLYTNREYKMLDDVNKTFKVPFVAQGTSVILKPEFKSLDAVRILLNGVIEESDKTCDDLHEHLVAGKLGARGLKSQIKLAEELEGRLSSYSKALGLDLNDLNCRVAELKAGLGVALAHEIEL